MAVVDILIAGREQFEATGAHLTGVRATGTDNARLAP